MILNMPVQAYPWGSTTLIPRLRGVPPTGEPQAELWAGAHLDAPATVIEDGRPRSLAELIATDPEGALGADIAERFRGQLPYLLKVLAIGSPLSIQVHPTNEQAAEGFAREEHAGVAIDAPERNYRDHSAKPEMLVALTEVEALAGFREPAAAAEAMASLGAEGLDDVVGALRAGGVVALEAAVRYWLRLDGAELADLTAEAVKAAATATGELAALLRILGDRYPGDRGLLLAMLLEHVQLAPGEAISIGPGVPHQYLSGLAVEAQASSNNTLRAGLTGKHVDPVEVLRLLTYGPAPEVLAGDSYGNGVTRYDTGAAEFVLDRVTLGGRVRSKLLGPRIVLCTEGSATVSGGGTAVNVGPGEALFCPASDGEVTLSGAGTAFVVAPGCL